VVTSIHSDELSEDCEASLVMVVQLERSGDGSVESSELERGKIVSDSEKDNE